MRTSPASPQKDQFHILLDLYTLFLSPSSVCVCVCVCACMRLVAQSCLTLCNLWTVCNSPGSSVHGILQARILEWVAMPASRGSFWPRNQTHVSCIAGIFFTIWATREALSFLLSTSHYHTIYLIYIPNRKKPQWAWEFCLFGSLLYPQLLE